MEIASRAGMNIPEDVVFFLDEDGEHDRKIARAVQAGENNGQPYRGPARPHDRPCHPEQVLQGLPTDILVRIQEFTKEFRPVGMVTNYGILPAEDQVKAARKWIDANLTVHY